MKSNKSKHPTGAVNKGKGRSQASKNFSRPARAGGALNLPKERTSDEKIDISAIIKKTGARADKKLPELLAPAGSLDSLKAAIAGGADAVYFGGGDFNARINAKNFTNEELKQAIDLLHSCGKKAYITLNTLVHDREIDEYLRFAEFVYLAGADALIVADLGGAEAIHRHLPSLELHASTQMSGHNIAQARLLSEHGFSRMVCARELPREDIESLVKSSPIEIEAFVHGALCVCHSGQCLFSSLVGGRSGNRGECAQPCRLPYQGGKDQSYPLSLKDLSLAGHITELVECGVHSLKIEGRMKSPEYVFGVVRAFRTLLDEGRNATPAELASLAKIFSRGGFTDGYYSKRIDSSMLGIRSDEEKQFSKLSLMSSEKTDGITPQKTPVSMHARVVNGKKMSLRLHCGGICVTAYGDEPQRAINAPLSAENIKKNLTKLGATAFELENYTAETGEDIIVPVSALNALRREACERLQAALDERREKRIGFEKYIEVTPKSQRKTQKTARFYSAEQITDSARGYFDIIYLPLQAYHGECQGIVVPPVIFDSERETVERMLESARKNGAKYALVGNLGALELAEKHGFMIHGDFRFNVYNNESAAKLEGLGVESIILSPELTLPQMRDIEGDTAAIVYGRVPLMLLEKCAAKEISSCAECQRAQKCPSCAPALTDRRGVSFPVLREHDHRSTVYNSAPTYMADRENDLLAARISNRHFIFSTESPANVDRIITAHKNHSPAPTGERIRRI